MNSNTSPIRRSIERTTVFESPCKQVQGRQWPPCESPRCFPTEAFLSLAHTLCKPFSYSSRTTSGHRSTRFFFLRFSMESRDEWIQKFRTKKKNTVWPYVIDHHLVSIASPQNKKKKKIFIPRRESRNLWAVCPPTWSILFDDEKNFVVFFFFPLFQQKKKKRLVYISSAEIYWTSV